MPPSTVSSMITPGQLHEGGAERLGRQRSSPRGSAQAQYDADDERGQYVHAHEHALVGEYQARVAGDGASQPAAAGLDRVDRDGLGDRDGRRDGSLRPRNMEDTEGMASTAVTDMADTTGSAGASPADLVPDGIGGIGRGSEAGAHCPATGGCEWPTG